MFINLKTSLLDWGVRLHLGHFSQAKVVIFRAKINLILAFRNVCIKKYGHVCAYLYVFILTLVHLQIYGHKLLCRICVFECL